MNKEKLQDIKENVQDRFADIGDNVKDAFNIAKVRTEEFFESESFENIKYKTQKGIVKSVSSFFTWIANFVKGKY